MAREIDRRDFSVNKVIRERELELRSIASEVSDRLPGKHRLRIKSFDATTGNPSLISSDSAPAEKEHYIERALEHVQNISRVLGFAPTQTAEYIADPDIQKTSSGAVAVHLQQQYKGISIFQAAQAVRFSTDGALKETAGSSVTITKEKCVSPRVSVQEAVLKAAQHVAVPEPKEEKSKDQFGQPLRSTRVDLKGFVPKIIATFPNKAEKPTVMEAGPFGDEIKADLIWFPLGDELRLSWEVVLTMPNLEGQYRLMVDADTGELLYCRQLMKSLAARGNVYLVDGGNPRQIVEFPRPLDVYGLPIPGDLPPSFPDEWVETDQTSGNSVRAHLGEVGSMLQGSVEGDIISFDPTDPFGDDQKVLNIFYYNCFMHDYFYLLGFREADGNFQQNNFGRGGVHSDRVDARAHSGVVWGTANMFTPVDGLNPVMNMGLVDSTNRHTAFDSTVVFHEFTHGITNRLVGGPMNDHALEAPQSGGMGEGWSDYIACTINNTTVAGAWVVDDPGGIRGFPYDSEFPDHFGNLGAGRYMEHPMTGEVPVHNIGEIWCATLMEMNRKVGATLGVQLVVDALKLSPANPSFLDMRDAILLALDNTLEAGRLNSSEHSEAKNGIWVAFAKFGMGPNASSIGASLSGIVVDFNILSEISEDSVHVEASPNLSIPDNKPSGVTSILGVTKAGKIKQAAVLIDIEHTFIGDLFVTLTVPNGKTVILHNRSGGSTNNVVKTYTTDDVLATIVGDQVQGDWKLKVADLAKVDKGELRHWSIDVEIETATETISGKATPALTIPDNDPAGIGSVIGISQSGHARGIKVGVDITHTFIGDLRVELIAPSGQQAILHNRAGGGQDNLIETYDSVATSSLTSLVGDEIEGNWMLRVTDLAGRDVGKLNKWSLELTL